MVQIMNHKWINEMDEEDKASALITDTLPDSEFSEEVLTMMLARGIDREKTIQVLIFCLIIIRDYIEHKWGHGGLMVCALVSGWSAPDSSPGRRCCVLAIACVAARMSLSPESRHATKAILAKTLHSLSAFLNPG